MGWLKEIIKLKIKLLPVPRESSMFDPCEDHVRVISTDSLPQNLHRVDIIFPACPI